MFNIGGTELLLILFIAFVVVGPKDLPKLGKALGKAVRFLRSMIQEVRRETGLDEVDSAVKDIRKDIRQMGKDMDIREDIDAVRKEADIGSELKGLKKDMTDIRRSVDLKAELKEAGKEADLRPDIRKMVSGADSELKEAGKEADLRPDIRKMVSGADSELKSAGKEAGKALAGTASESR